MEHKKIILGHGSGAGLTHKLISEVFAQTFKINHLDDACKISDKMVISTDSYVVNPLFFPGGDIGKLSVSGTINDVAMSGARPTFLVAGFIIEEGFEISALQKIVCSMQKTAQQAGVQIIAGDTKVVEKGKGDGIYISTTGVGILGDGDELSVNRIQVGDKLVVNGTLGDHAVAIINARDRLELDPPPMSDCCALNNLVQAMLKSAEVKFLRDLTRGGLATILNEVIENSDVGIIISEELLPIKQSVSAVCGLLGLDPLYLANEGKLVGFVSEDERLLDEMKKHNCARDAAIIGEVTDEVKGVYLRTTVGSLRPLPILNSDPLPRIC
jgi:hydrogenase expression/formation protein HypE